jgi:hypothetical protein
LSHKFQDNRVILFSEPQFQRGFKTVQRKLVGQGTGKMIPDDTPRE